MPLRLVQPGLGATRPLVAMFLASGDLDTKIRAAFGPAPCIIADHTKDGKETLLELVEFAHKSAGVSQVSKLALVGYSAGCQRVRKLQIDGANADAFLLSDGTHASWPPQEWQIAWLRDIANQARKGQKLVVASHTWNTYTETLKEKAYASTVTVLRKATGFPLEKGGPPEAPVVSNDGQLWVYSYASKDADMVAHSYQAMVVQPKLAAAHVAPWLLNGPQASPRPEPTKEPARTSSSSGDIDEGILFAGVAMLARRLMG